MCTPFFASALLVDPPFPVSVLRPIPSFPPSLSAAHAKRLTANTKRGSADPMKRSYSRNHVATIFRSPVRRARNPSEGALISSRNVVNLIRLSLSLLPLFFFQIFFGDWYRISRHAELLFCIGDQKARIVCGAGGRWGMKVIFFGGRDRHFCERRFFAAAFDSSMRGYW